MRVGLDLVEIPRVRSLLSRHGRRLEDRLFTPAEQQLCRSRADPAIHYAGRIAAKEAVRKVVGPVTWTQVEILAAAGGAPRVRLRGQGWAARLRRAGIRHVVVSITHTREWAAAVAIALPESLRRR